jgi:hypothetical protein
MNECVNAENTMSVYTNTKYKGLEASADDQRARESEEEYHRINLVAVLQSDRQETTRPNEGAKDGPHK